MSGLCCKDPNHTPCERCEGCTNCGCVCHLAVGGHDWQDDAHTTDVVCIRCTLPSQLYTDQECPGVPTEWTEDDSSEPVSDPLEPFSETEERKCPKCLYMGIKTQYHAYVVKGETPASPCENLVGWTYPQIHIGEHLCRRCTQCGYGWAEKTADA